MLVGELEGLDQTQGLVDVAADGQVVDGDLAEGALGVDDEETAQGDAFLLDQDAVVARDLEVLVGNQGELQVLAQTALLARTLAPGQVCEVAVGGDTQDGGVELLELGEGVVEGEDLGGADKGEVHGVEQEDDPIGERQGEHFLYLEIRNQIPSWMIKYLPLALVLGERDLLELTVLKDGGGREGRSGLLNKRLGRHDDGCG